MSPPGLHVESRLSECPLPRVNVQVVGIDQGAIDIEQQRCADEERAEVIDFRNTPISLGFPRAPVRNGVGESAINAAFTDGPARGSHRMHTVGAPDPTLYPGWADRRERKLHG